jgi:BirA family transcriptional regulator, biotin operon repressor / biotin---[acetyl-CoA-carboxylase] ligase
MRLHATAVAAGHRLVARDTLSSTNEEALSLANAEALSATSRGIAGDAAAPLWVTARQQCAGRGRSGRQWTSPPGNLYTTLLLDEPAPQREAPELSFVAALAAHDAILACAPALWSQLALKWPNDLLCGGGKLAGILIEGTQLNDRLAVAIGIGVNCVSHPEQTAYPATDLKTAGANVAPEDLFCALSGTMVRRLAQWQRGAGFAAIRSDWLNHATLGGEMRVRFRDREFVGRGEALDEAGRLLLRLADGRLQTITAGDVFPLAAGEYSRRVVANNAWPNGTR